jgi:hypothetical protein
VVRSGKLSALHLGLTVILHCEKVRWKIESQYDDVQQTWI